MAIEIDTIVARPLFPLEGMRISWGGVFGGVLAGIGALMLLSSLGIAIGISATDPRNPDGGALGMGAAIWTGLTLLISLFIAGWASTRLSMMWERTTALFEGVLVWVLSLILILYLTANGIGLIASSAFSMLNTAQAVSTSGAVSNSAEASAEVRRSLDALAASASENLSRTAVDAKPEVVTAAWLTFAGLVLSLLAAILGSAVGRRGVLGIGTSRGR